MNKTSIEWCVRPETRGAAGAMTWNPIRARRIDIHQDDHETKRTGTFCTRISPGCTNCYASTINKRFGNGLEFTVPNLDKIEFFVDERILDEPRRQHNPCTIFVGDMFDLFHESIPAELIAEVLRVAIKTPHHTYQFLTKRAQRMRDLVNRAQEHWGQAFGEHMWFGVSVEDNKRAIERIPRLQETECFVRFLSVEPQLEEINFTIDEPMVGAINLLRGFDGCDPVVPGIDWVICGGESGPGARPFNLAWAESIQDQCADAAVPFFLKQIGSKPYWPCDPGGIIYPPIKDRKGGDPADWPEHLRVREFPTVGVREAVTA